MVLLSGGEFQMGTDNPGIPVDGEGPRRLVQVDSFYMDIQEVTNQQFQIFVNATGYVTEVFVNHLLLACNPSCVLLNYCLFLFSVVGIKLPFPFYPFRQRNLETLLFLREF